MTKKQYPKLNRPKLKLPFSKAPDHKDILAITEGKFGKPITKSSRFINANHPPKDATKEELEAIARFWGDPDDVVLLRDKNIKHCRKKASNQKRKQLVL